MDKKEIKIVKSKDRARTVQERAKAWEDLNKKMVAKKAREEAAALDLALGQENLVDGGDWEEEAMEEVDMDTVVPAVGELDVSDLTPLQVQTATDEVDEVL